MEKIREFLIEALDKFEHTWNRVT